MWFPGELVSQGEVRTTTTHSRRAHWFHNAHASLSKGRLCVGQPTTHFHRVRGYTQI